MHIPGETNLSKPMAEAKRTHAVPRQGASWDTVGRKSPGPQGSLRSGWALVLEAHGVFKQKSVMS